MNEFIVRQNKFFHMEGLVYPELVFPTMKVSTRFSNPSVVETLNYFNFQNRLVNIKRAFVIRENEISFTNG